MAPPMSAGGSAEPARGGRRHRRRGRRLGASQPQSQGALGAGAGVMIHQLGDVGQRAHRRDLPCGPPGPARSAVPRRPSPGRGVLHLVGYGRANHAGLGDDDVLRAVIAEKALPPDDEANTNGNRHFYGFE